MNDWLLYLVPLTGLAGLLFAWHKARWIHRQDPGTERMREIAGYVQEGALAFLRREYSVLGVFIVVLVLLSVLVVHAALALIALVLVRHVDLLAWVA